MERNPKVSIIIPTYNRSTFIVETIQSIINQTYTNLEIIVVDDFSSDNTIEVICENFGLLTNLTLIKNASNQGESAAINTGWETTSGNLVAIVSSDDPQDPSWLHKMVIAINSDPGSMFYYPNLRIIDGNGVVLADVMTKVWSKSLIFSKLICVASAGTIINKGLLPKTFKPRDSSIVYPSDLIQFLEISKLGTGSKVDSAFGVWRQHHSSLTFNVDQAERATIFFSTVNSWLKRNSNLYENFLRFSMAKSNLMIQVWFMLREQYGIFRSILNLFTIKVFRTQVLSPIFQMLLIYRIGRKKFPALFRKIDSIYRFF